MNDEPTISQKFRAKDILKAYRENNYNASKALVKVGYKPSTAQKASKPIIEKAIKQAVIEEIKEIEENPALSPRNKLLSLVGISENELLNEYMYIVKQNKDLTNKLKALTPLLKTVGVEWNEQATTVNPTLNLTVEQVTPIDGSVKPLIDTVVHEDKNDLRVGGGRMLILFLLFPYPPSQKVTK